LYWYVTLYCRTNCVAQKSWYFTPRWLVAQGWGGEVDCACPALFHRCNPIHSLHCHPGIL